MKHAHLAQINIARMVASLEDPLMAGFVAQLETINTVADQSPGFVWRLQGEEGNATGINAFGDARILINMSVWESVEALQQYTYRSQHAGVFRDRKRWFEPLGRPHMALWWIPAGHKPTPTEGKQRLELLQSQGPTAEAFTFKQHFPAPVSLGAGVLMK
ncbi:MAG: DUF3291 domain-containing protein [Anaerolineae bacterium]|nr:DUF3291 domain-containing protein [Anaerolineae bacterium]